MSVDEKEKLKSWQKERNKRTPSPDSYWQTERFSPKNASRKSPKNKKNFREIYNKDGTKTLLIDRRITDRAVYSPKSSHIF